MRFSLAVVIIVVGISVSGLAQQNGAKASAPVKAPKQSAPMPMGRAGGPGTSSAANAKELKAIENQTAKVPATPQSAGKKTPGKASGLKPVKDKPNPPINFGGTSASKTPGTNHQGSNGYKGRLKQKGTGHQ
jgi:hypothetical protein